MAGTSSRNAMIAAAAAGIALGVGGALLWFGSGPEPTKEREKTIRFADEVGEDLETAFDRTGVDKLTDKERKRFDTLHREASAESRGGLLSDYEIGRIVETVKLESHNKGVANGRIPRNPDGSYPKMPDADVPDIVKAARALKESRIEKGRQYVDEYTRTYGPAAAERFRAENPQYFPQADFTVEPSTTIGRAWDSALRDQEALERGVVPASAREKSVTFASTKDVRHIDADGRIRDVVDLGFFAEVLSDREYEFFEQKAEESMARKGTPLTMTELGVVAEASIHKCFNEDLDAGRVHPGVEFDVRRIPDVVQQYRARTETTGHRDAFVEELQDRLLQPLVQEEHRIKRELTRAPEAEDPPARSVREAPDRVGNPIAPEGRAAGSAKAAAPPPPPPPASLAAAASAPSTTMADVSLEGLPGKLRAALRGGPDY